VSAREPSRSRPATRHERIVDEVRRAGGFLHVTVLAERLGVSAMTIRRDLSALERAGTVRRTRGGVLVQARRVALVEPPFRQRQSVNSAAKRSIARAAAALVEPGDTIGIDVGSTTLELCPLLADVSPLHVITSSLPVASGLAGTAEVYTPGGRVRPDELSLVGSTAQEGVARFHLDIVVVGAAALDEEAAYDYSVEDTEIKKAMIKRAQRVVLLCDASKYGRRSAVTVCDLATVSTLVTDAAPDESLAAALARAGVEVVVAPPDHT
jgi:DeoR/GlpR family transcriptional regulator of sugar metabolism